jgi:uroporphyrin-III C-methyltransferase
MTEEPKLESDATVGRVSLVGAGPGDPELITVRGMRALSAADAVVHDFMVHPALLDCARADAQIICAGKHAGHHTLEQEAINALLVALARGGKTVCRLKGGDPFVFGRGGEEALALAEAGIPFEVVPGVSSAVAVPAYAGIPVTHRGLARSCHVITGHGMPDDAAWPVPPQKDGTLLFLMGLKRLDSIAARLIAEGWPAETPAAAISHGTLPGQKTVVGTLADIAARVAAAELESPTVLVVGAVVALRASLAWHETKGTASGDAGDTERGTGPSD